VEPGIDGIKQMMNMFYSAFPDLKVTVNQLVAERDLVMGHMTTEGTQTGEFMGIPDSGKKDLHHRDEHGPDSQWQSCGALGSGQRHGHDAAIGRDSRAVGHQYGTHSRTTEKSA
jgi:hypothetical protein